MTHYAHKHVVLVTSSRCEPCDCYVCVLNRWPLNRRVWHRERRERQVERVLEEIERQLRDVGTTSITRVWNSLTRWPYRIIDEFELPSSSLVSCIRNVFKSLDQHGMIECARYDKVGKRCMVWREKRRGH